MKNDLNIQLAAERKKNDDWRNTERRVAKERDEARKQLATELSNYDLLRDDYRAIADSNQKLREQVVAEREKVHRCEVIHRHAETIELLKKQLAAEREKVGDACRATFGVNAAWQDRFDLIRDELLRIKACPNVSNEVIGICDRAEQDIRRRVPLIDEIKQLQQQLAAERERADKAAARAELAQIALAAEREKVAELTKALREFENEYPHISRILLESIS